MVAHSTVCQNWRCQWKKDEAKSRQQQNNGYLLVWAKSPVRCRNANRHQNKFTPNLQATVSDWSQFNVPNGNFSNGNFPKGFVFLLFWFVSIFSAAIFMHCISHDIRFLFLLEFTIFDTNIPIPISTSASGSLNERPEKLV